MTKFVYPKTNSRTLCRLPGVQSNKKDCIDLEVTPKVFCIALICINLAISVTKDVFQFNCVFFGRLLYVLAAYSQMVISRPEKR